MRLTNEMADEHRSAMKGCVTLVGAGPGDPELLTIAAVKAIAAADVILVDTGDTGTVSIGYDAFLALPRLFTPSGRSVASGVSAAAMDTVDGELARINIGSAAFDHVAISAVRGQHRGHLGYGFATRCARFVLDLGHRSMACLAGDDRTRS